MPVGSRAIPHVVSEQDSDERAVANIGGGAPNRWGKGDKYHQEAQTLQCFFPCKQLIRPQMMVAKKFSWDAPNSKLKDHPPGPQPVSQNAGQTIGESTFRLYPSMCLMAMREVAKLRASCQGRVKASKPEPAGHQHAALLHSLSPWSELQDKG